MAYYAILLDIKLLHSSLHAILCQVIYIALFIPQLIIIHNQSINQSIKNMNLQSFNQFLQQVNNISFPKIEQAFLRFSHQQDNKWLSPYVPTLHQYSLEIDQHPKQDFKMARTPSFNKKKSFNNDQNLHRKIIDIFKAYLLSDYKDLKEYMRLTLDIQQLSNILSRTQILRFKSAEFNLLYFLIISDRKSIKIYIKLREDILKKETFDKTKFLPISIHNAAKYENKYIYLESVNISCKHWKQFINLIGFEFDEQFVSMVFDERKEVSAVELILLALWINQQYVKYNPSPNK